MGTLRLQGKGEEAREFKLNLSRMVIGRRPSCDIHLKDPAVSGEHALIINILDDSFIENLSQTNGTIVNGKRVEKGVLQDGDEIKLGNQVLVYHADTDAPGVDEDDFEKTMVLRPGQLARDVAKPDVVKAIQDAEDTAAMKAIDVEPEARAAVLKVLSGPAKGKEVRIDRPMVTLGRPGVQVVVISRRKNGYFISFISGASGNASRPSVNGKTLQIRGRQLLDGDVINLAGVEIRFST